MDQAMKHPFFKSEAALKNKKKAGRFNSTFFSSPQPRNTDPISHARGHSVSQHRKVGQHKHQALRKSERVNLDRWLQN